MKLKLWMSAAAIAVVSAVISARAEDPAKTLKITYRTTTFYSDGKGIGHENEITGQGTIFIDAVNGRLKIENAATRPGDSAGDLYLRFGSSDYYWNPANKFALYGDYPVPNESVWAPVRANIWGMTKMGEEKIVGKPCIVYEDKEKRHAEKYRVWVWNGWVLKEEIVVKAWSGGSNYRERVRIREAVLVQPDAPISEEEFAPPAKTLVLSHAIVVKPEELFKSLVITYRYTPLTGKGIPSERTLSIDGIGMRVRIESRVLSSEDVSLVVKGAPIEFEGQLHGAEMTYGFGGPLAPWQIWEEISVPEAIVSVPQSGAIVREPLIPVGQEEILGKPCTLYERKYGAETYRIWVWNGIVMKQQETRGGEPALMKEAIALELNAPMPDERFVPPLGVRLKPRPAPVPPTP